MLLTLRLGFAKLLAYQMNVSVLYQLSYRHALTWECKQDTRNISGIIYKLLLCNLLQFVDTGIGLICKLN